MSIHSLTTSIVNIDKAILGMRNPMNSCGLSDSRFNKDGFFILGTKDSELACKLIKAGPEHRKFLRQAFLYLEVSTLEFKFDLFKNFKYYTNTKSWANEIAIDKNIEFLNHVNTYIQPLEELCPNSFNVFGYVINFETMYIIYNTLKRYTYANLDQYNIFSHIFETHEVFELLFDDEKRGEYYGFLTDIYITNSVQSVFDNEKKKLSAKYSYPYGDKILDETAFLFCEEKPKRVLESYSIYFPPVLERHKLLKNMLLSKEQLKDLKEIIYKNDQSLLLENNNTINTLKSIKVNMSINAPIYWWKEFDTYKVGTTANSTSTMHTLMKNNISEKDFAIYGDPEELECHNFFNKKKELYKSIINFLEESRQLYNDKSTDGSLKKELFNSIINILPSSFLQKRNITIDYYQLLRIYFQRKNHKLAEWRIFTDDIKNFSILKDIINYFEGRKCDLCEQYPSSIKEIKGGKVVCENCFKEILNAFNAN